MSEAHIARGPGRTLIHCQQLITGGECFSPAAVVVAGDIIETVIVNDAAKFVEGEFFSVVHVHTLTPGFVDIHCHGYGGSDNVYDFWANPDFSRRVCAASGTTSVIATLVFQRGPEAEARNQSVISKLNAVIGQLSMDGAVIEGIHAEGPIIKDCGGLPDSEVDMIVEKFESLLDTMPHLKVMTIAPSQEAKVDYARIRCLTKRGVRASLGHDRSCTEQQVCFSVCSCCVATVEVGGFTSVFVVLCAVVLCCLIAAVDHWSYACRTTHALSHHTPVQRMQLQSPRSFFG